MCPTFSTIFAGHIALIDAHDWRSNSPYPQYLWRRAALKPGWWLVRQEGQQGLGYYINSERIVPERYADTARTIPDIAEDPLSLLGAVAEDILVVGDLMDDWPGKAERALLNPYCGLIFSHTTPTTEAQMLAPRQRFVRLLQADRIARR